MLARTPYAQEEDEHLRGTREGKVSPPITAAVLSSDASNTALPRHKVVAPLDDVSLSPTLSPTLSP